MTSAGFNSAQGGNGAVEKAGNSCGPGCTCGPGWCADSSGQVDVSDPRVASAIAKAKEAANVVNPPSVAQNKEYGSFVFTDANGNLQYTSTVSSACNGATCSMNVGALYNAVPSEQSTVLLYHSHGAATPGSELFSDVDVTTLNAMGARNPNFLGGIISTGRGNLRFYPSGVLPDGTFTPGVIVGHVPIR